MKNSKIKIDIIHASKSHIDDLHSKIKQSDVDEVMASHGLSAKDALVMSFDNSYEAYTIMVNDSPEMMFGVVRDEYFSDAAIVWMLSSEEVFSMMTVKGFMKKARHYIKKFHEEKIFIYNFIDERNLRSLGWLKKCGFRFVRREEEYGVAKIPFVMAVSERR